MDLAQEDKLPPNGCGMMGVKLIIPGTLPNLNDYIAAERIHRQKGAAMKK